MISFLLLQLIQVCHHLHKLIFLLLEEVAVVFELCPVESFGVYITALAFDDLFYYIGCEDLDRFIHLKLTGFAQLFPELHVLKFDQGDYVFEVDEAVAVGVNLVKHGPQIKVIVILRAECTLLKGLRRTHIGQPLNTVNFAGAVRVKSAYFTFKLGVDWFFAV